MDIFLSETSLSARSKFQQKFMTLFWSTDLRNTPRKLGKVFGEIWNYEYSHNIYNNYNFDFAKKLANFFKKEDENQYIILEISLE